MRTTNKRSRRKGFTLIEAAIATCIIGMGIASLMAGLGAYSRANGGATEITEAIFLLQEIREWTVRLPFSDPDAADAGNPPGLDTYDYGVVDDLDDLMGATYNAPLNARGEAMYDKMAWSQQVTLTYLDSDDLTAVPAGASGMVRVEVEMTYQGRHIYSAGWLVNRG